MFAHYYLQMQNFKSFAQSPRAEVSTFCRTEYQAVKIHNFIFTYIIYIYITWGETLSHSDGMVTSVSWKC